MTNNVGDTECSITEVDLSCTSDLARVFGKGNNFNSSGDSNTNMANSALISPPPTDVDRTSLARTEIRHKISSRQCLVEMGRLVCGTVN